LDQPAILEAVALLVPTSKANSLSVTFSNRLIAVFSSEPVCMGVFCFQQLLLH
jgi:hypothetical protein